MAWLATPDSHPPPESPRGSFSLTPRQASLREALAAQSAEAARLYVGGLRVLADEANPCSLRLASTAMRELIDELAVAGGVVGLRGESVKSRINNLCGRVKRLSALLRVPKPSAEHVAKLLDHLDEFFRREEQVSPSRKQKARLVVAAISIGADSPDRSWMYRRIVCSRSAVPSVPCFMVAVARDFRTSWLISRACCSTC